MSINQGNSNSVESNQQGVHEHLNDYLEKYSFENYQRPIADFSKVVWGEIISFIGNDPVIFDLGCGVGESSYHLAINNPEIKVVGIDKSISRLDRNNSFKEEIPKNMKLFRGELLDLIPIIYQEQYALDIKSVYILYPNPWPKKHHIKRRFYASPVSIHLFNINACIIKRSNWKLYLEESLVSANFFNRESSGVTIVEPKVYMTPFEKKFSQSAQTLYELKIIDKNMTDK